MNLLSEISVIQQNVKDGQTEDQEQNESRIVLKLTCKSLISHAQRKYCRMIQSHSYANDSS